MLFSTVALSVILSFLVTELTGLLLVAWSALAILPSTSPSP